MNVIKAADVREGDLGGPDDFEGEVRLRSVGQVKLQAGVAVVSFRQGARTHSHTHAGGQVLHVLSGRGRVRSDGGETVDLGPGDFVVAEPGEKHWHGAAPGEDMAHISIASGDVKWLEKVED